MHLVAVNDTCMYYRRRVVACVYAFKRIGNDRTAEITLGVTLGNALIYSFVKTSADKMDVLTDVEENNSQSRVLTDCDVLAFCGFDIAHEVTEDFPSRRGFFAIG